MQKDRVIDSRHPDFLANMENWEKFRAVLNGGKAFVTKYLQMFSSREDANDFAIRSTYTYNPSHAKSAALDVRNSIYERLNDITRESPDDDYITICSGKMGGVNRKNATMTYFMGKEVLTELLFLGKVGIFVDKEPINPEASRAEGVKQPYLYLYKAENILSWSYGADDQLDTLLLRDVVETRSITTGLVNGREFQYRYFQRVPQLDKVLFRVYRALGNGNEEVIKQGFLDLPRIPFIIGELTQSLMAEVADYQIALLNMESSDVYAAIKNNFSFYVEQYDPQAENAYAKIKDVDGVDAQETGEVQQQRSQIHGVAMGRKYPKGLERPSFINPSPEPLSISMEKEDKIRNDIYRLVNLNISMMESRHASEASRKMDYRGLETNLSYIALELQYIDSEIAVVWAFYQNTAPATVKYPNNYELRGTRERREEATSLLKSLAEVTSQPLRKQIVIKAAHLLFNGDLTDSEIRELVAKINAEKIILTSDECQTMVEIGVLSRKFFGEQIGLPATVVADAMAEHAERAANLVRAQNEAGDAGGDDGEANRQRKQDSQNADNTANGGRRVRGKA